ncbi:hypothetical protein H9Q72_010424 [Fusarium xylarioides]|uniref:Uncharacterized protein n=1 Tax=Fusarium xylarioides TaxID=221167 RepID=A0A9P7L568_9HYPO|nr:hypothetical protein H9Q72_010424 [Fusarium xylarioides]
MSERNQTQGEAAGGGGPSSHHGGGGGGGGIRGGYNNSHGNYQGHGNWANTPNYPTPHPNYNQNPQMGPGYNQNFQGFNQNLPMGQGYNQNSQMGPGYNTNQFEPNLPWQPGNEPSNPFSQSHQASQTPQSQNNGGQGWGRRKRAKKSHEVDKVTLREVETDKGPSLDIFNESKGGGRQAKFHKGINVYGTPVQAFGRQNARELNEGIKRQFPEDAKLHALIWRAPVLVRGSSTTATPVVLGRPIRQQLIAPEDDGFADDAEILPDVEVNEESNTQALAQNTAAPNAQVPAQTEPEVCAACRQPGHEVIQCWHIGPDGFTHGCGICNSAAHETDGCPRFPKDPRQQLEILVTRRACLPPLRSKFWYAILWRWATANPSVDVDDIFPRFPWSTDFAKDALNGENRGTAEEMLINMRNNPDMERSMFLADPSTETWAKAQETYGGSPKNFYAKLTEIKVAASQQRVANAGAQGQQGLAYVAAERNDIASSSSQTWPTQQPRTGQQSQVPVTIQSNQGPSTTQVASAGPSQATPATTVDTPQEMSKRDRVKAAQEYPVLPPQVVESAMEGVQLDLDDNMEATDEIHFVTIVKWGYGIPSENGPLKWFKLSLLEAKDIPVEVAASTRLQGAHRFKNNMMKHPIEIIAAFFEGGYSTEPTRHLKESEYERIGYVGFDGALACLDFDNLSLEAQARFASTQSDSDGDHEGPQETRPERTPAQSSPMPRQNLLSTFVSVARNASSLHRHSAQQRRSPRGPSKKEGQNEHSLRTAQCPDRIRC